MIFLTQTGFIFLKVQYYTHLLKRKYIWIIDINKILKVGEKMEITIRLGFVSSLLRRKSLQRRLHTGNIPKFNILITITQFLQHIWIFRKFYLKAL